MNQQHCRSKSKNPYLGDLNEKYKHIFIGNFGIFGKLRKAKRKE